ncbi:MAG: DEAD/DEAH box helicase, partial [Flavobacteriales bacterium]|nr:DEAD/DEAH box helicase [Flavobacteriales bacterium]
MSNHSNITQLLLKYWGFTTFREQQEEIIRSVLEQKDTLALLPTGGGKSICFQIPFCSSGAATTLKPAWSTPTVTF